MKLLATLQRSGGIDALARHAGMPVERAAHLSEALLAPLMLGMRHMVRASGGGCKGVGALLELIASEGGGALAAQVLSHDPVDSRAGGALAGRFLPPAARRDGRFGRPVAEVAANPGEIGRLLPLLAMLVCGYIAAQVGGSGARGTGGVKSLGPVLDMLTSDSVGEDAAWLL